MGKLAGKQNKSIERKPYPSEDDFFKKNPNVAGMATEDDRVIINQYKNMTPAERSSVVKNETIRIKMRKSGFIPDIKITEQQKKAFAGTAYGKDENALKQTIIARILSGDPSAQATPEQIRYAKSLDMNNLKRRKRKSILAGD